MKAFLTVALLTLACAMFTSVALAAGTDTGHHAAGTGRGDHAASTGTGHHHGRPAQVVCTIKAKSKHHRRRAAKQARKCVRRTQHVKRLHSIGMQSGEESSHPGKRTKQAQPSSHPKPFSHQSSHPRETTVSAAPSTAATIAKVLGTTCENTELMPEAGNLEAVEQSTLCLVNQERARSGELPLQGNTELSGAAEGHSAEMVSKDYFAHVSPSGETPLQRIEATGYIPNSQVGYTLGENIAWGTLYLATPKAIVAAWIASPEHLANILNAAYTETGLGVVPSVPVSLAEGEPGAVYSQEFGVIEG